MWCGVVKCCGVLRSVKKSRKVLRSAEIEGKEEESGMVRSDEKL
jgi:hypothetical protein